MAPVPKTTKTIKHFIHPGHDLSKISTNGEYLCGGCRTPGGAGVRYRCCHHHCDFSLHEYCGSCPATLPSFMHPHHPLTLVARTQGPRQKDRICDLCGDSVEGLFYRCKTCDFDIHPMCTQLPQHVHHVLHPLHRLRLILPPPSLYGWCAVCRSPCSSWRYRCESCSFDIHIECMLVAAGSGGESTSRSVPPSGPPPPPQWGWPPPPHGYGAPPGFFPEHNPVGQAQGGGQPSKGKELSKMMYKLVGKLTIGVLTSMQFGMPDFSSFSD